MNVIPLSNETNTKASSKTIPPVRHRRTTSLYEREVSSYAIPPLACKGRQMLASVGIFNLIRKKAATIGLSVVSAISLTLTFSPIASAILLTLNLNGAAPNVYTTSTDSSTITIPSTIVDFDNLTITSWNTCPDGTGTTYHKGDTLTTSTTLYAQWSNGLRISDTVSGCGAVTPTTYGSLSDLKVVSALYNGSTMSDFDPTKTATYEVEDITKVSIDDDDLDNTIWSMSTKYSSGNYRSYTYSAKSSATETISVTYTFKQKTGTTDPDEPEETYGSLDDLNNITVTVNGKELTTFDPQDLDGVYEVDSTSTIVLKSTGLDAWTITRSNPTSSSLVFTLTSKDKDGNELKAVYTFKVKSSNTDDDKDDIKDDDDGNKNDNTKDDSGNDNGNNTNNTTGKIDGDNTSGGSSNSSSSKTTNTVKAPVTSYASLPTKLTMPISFILAGILAIVAVLKLTKKEASSSKKTIPPVRHGRTTSLYEREVLKSIPPLAGKGRQMSGSSSVGINSLKSAGRHFFTGRARYAVLSLAILSLVTGTFFLAKTISNAADSTNIYAGYEGYFTVGETMASGETTWWKDGVKQSGQSSRNGKWHWFETDDAKLMAVNKEVNITSEYNNNEGSKWVRYDSNGDMIYGQWSDGTDWWYYDDATGAMKYSWQKITADGVTKQVYYDTSDGRMVHGWKDTYDQLGKYWVTIHADESTGEVVPFWTEGSGADQFRSAYSMALLAARVAPTSEGVSSAIQLNTSCHGTCSEAWQDISGTYPAAAEYVKLANEVSRKYYTDGNSAYASCTQAVAHIIRATVDPDVEASSTDTFEAYMESSPRWATVTTDLGSANLNDTLQPGDILSNGQHTLMYIGHAIAQSEYSQSTGNTFEADISTAQYPHLAQHDTYSNHPGGSFKVYRYVPGDYSYTKPLINPWRFLAGQSSYIIGQY